MNYLKFLIEYFKSPRTVGAVAPSSEKLAQKMVQDIDFNSAKCIVEYGPGTGVFTEVLIKKRREGTLLLLVEYNKVFYNGLVNKYGDLNDVLIINDSAENIDKHLKKYNIKVVDYIVSGLPFASLPKNVSGKILKTSGQMLKRKGVFITFQYTLFKKEYIRSYFKNVEYDRVFLNFPPAYVLRCQNR
ncbi:MAG TPA: SAM-dependent methyltransferase [Clostridiaceae bacterium]